MNITKHCFILLYLIGCLTPVFGFYIQPETGVNAVFRLNKQDTLFFFDGEPRVMTSDGSKVDWYTLLDTLTPIATNTSTCYNFESGDGILAKTDSTRATCFVFNYRLLKPQITSVNVTYFCSNTEIEIPNTTNTIPEITYTNSKGATQVYDRTFVIHYNDLTWNETAWDSVPATDSFQLSYGSKNAPPMYSDQPNIRMQYDDIANELYGQYYDVASINFNNSPIAITSHPTSTTSVREALNEKERPKEASQITGSSPLNIFFQSNPTPNVEFVLWKIYKGSTLISQRSIQDHRYEFTDYGNYQVANFVSNSHCPCPPEEDCNRDSTVFDISVSVSMLNVPNVFTPNGDGVNDEFRVLYRSIREYHIEVYNRWGKLVYRSNDPSKGWDGTINNRPAAEGAYFYVIRAIGHDAEPNASFKSKAAYKKAKKNNSSSVLGVYQLSGDINLLR